jgi:ATP-dependent phosphofructokinase / diphosphate-dependent phosphofructokinase
VAVSIQEASLDVASMCNSSTHVFILEVMGSHSGWIAAAGGLAARTESEGPQIILFPEVAFNPEAFLARVSESVKKFGFCTIVASEGIRYQTGKFLADAGTQDAFGHKQLGGVAPQLAQLIKEKLGFKYHWAIADYLQRAAHHIASQVDVDQAYALGQAAVEFAIQGQNDVMPILIRQPTPDYQWTIATAALSEVANQEKALPKAFISPDGFHITPACRAYLLPLIQGEAYPTYSQGLADYFSCQLPSIPKKLPLPRASRVW